MTASRNNEDRRLFVIMIVSLGVFIGFLIVMAWWGITYPPIEPKTSRLEVKALVVDKWETYGMPPVGPLIVLSGDDHYLEVRYEEMTTTFRVSPAEYEQYEVGDRIRACLLTKEWPPQEDGSSKVKHELEEIESCP